MFRIKHIQHSCPFSRPANWNPPAAVHAAVQDSAVVPPGILTPVPNVLEATVSLCIPSQLPILGEKSLYIRETALIGPQTLSCGNILHNDGQRSVQVLEDVYPDRTATKFRAVSTAGHVAIGGGFLNTWDLNRRIAICAKLIPEGGESRQITHSIPKKEEDGVLVTVRQIFLDINLTPGR